MQFDADGNELRRVHLPNYPYHAVESPTGAFIVSHDNIQLDRCPVSEVNTGGEVLRQFTVSGLASQGLPRQIAVDSLSTQLNSTGHVTLTAKRDQKKGKKQQLINIPYL